MCINAFQCAFCGPVRKGYTNIYYWPSVTASMALQLGMQTGIHKMPGRLVKVEKTNGIEKQTGDKRVEKCHGFNSNFLSLEKTCEEYCGA